MGLRGTSSRPSPLISFLLLVPTLLDEGMCRFSLATQDVPQVEIAAAVAVTSTAEDLRLGRILVRGGGGASLDLLIMGGEK